MVFFLSLWFSAKAHFLCMAMWLFLLMGDIPLQTTTVACKSLSRGRVSKLSVCDQRIMNMENCSTSTIQQDWNPFCMPPLFWVTSGLLGLSLFGNIIFCVLKSCRSEKKTCWSRKKQSQSPQRMQDSPIYVNVSCMQTSTTAISEINPPHVMVSSSSLRDQRSSSSELQPQTPDCYANLSLKGPQPKSACSSPQIQYSVVLQSDESREEDKGNVHSAPTVSDVYASVQTKRTKGTDKEESAQDHANHI